MENNKLPRPKFEHKYFLGLIKRVAIDHQYLVYRRKYRRGMIDVMEMTHITREYNEIVNKMRWEDDKRKTNMEVVS